MTTITKRAKRYTTPVAQLRRWRSRGGQYALVEIVSTLGLPSRYVVIERLPNGNEHIVSRHRSRRPAERRLARLHEGE